MLQYGWRIMTGRASVWAFAFGCALLAAIPGALTGTVLATPVVAFVLTGNPLLSLSLLPGTFSESWVPAAAAWLGIGLCLLGALCLWARLYSAAVWGSDADNEAGIAVALKATRKRWRPVVRIYLESGLLLAAVVVPLASVAFAAGAFGPTAVFALAVALAGRSLIRITTTLAIRATVLDEAPDRAAWRGAIAVLRSRRADVAAVWIGLLGIGAAVWLGGRLISPVLQDTAFDYPSTSSFAAFREVAQLFLAVPLEAFLLVFSFGAWTAVYRDIEVRPGNTRAESPPWAARAAAAVLGLTIIVNGMATVIDAQYSEAQTGRSAEITGSEIEPEETLRAPSVAPGLPVSYDVHARLDDRELAWSTRVSYRNVTGERLRTLAFNLYPAAYARPLAQIPLAGDILAGDLSGSFRADAEPGSFEIDRVTVDGRRADTRLEDTSIVVRLPRSLENGSSVEVSIELSATMPIFPERFGTWRGTTLLGNWIPTVAVREDGAWRLDRFGPIGDPFVSQAADYRVAIEAHRAQRITGSGTLSKIEQTSEQTRTWSFEASGMRDVAYAASASMRALEQTSGGVVVRSWYDAGNADAGAANLESAASAISNYTRRFGTLPWDEVDVVLTPGLYGGMEYPGVVFVDQTGNSFEGLPILPELLKFSGFDAAQSRYVIGHELAHQWWYASVGNDQIREPWLDEAMAEISNITWLRATEGSDRTWRMTNLLSDPAVDNDDVFASVDEFSSNRDYTEAVYRGGAGVLLKLRARIGAERFDQVLRTYHADNRLLIATSDDFLDAIRKVAGESAADSFGR